MDIVFNNVFYTLNIADNTASVSTYKNNSFLIIDLIIPSTITDMGTTYSVTSIGNNAYQNSPTLTSVTIGSNVTSIGNLAFSACFALTSVTIGSNVTSIGNNAFYACISLTAVTIPDAVSSIGNAAFQGCSNLSSVTIGTGNTTFFNGTNGEVYQISGSDVSLIFCPRDATSIAILTNYNGYSVTSIGIAAFDGCTALTAVTIPDSVSSIGDYAFEGCTALTAVTIPDAVTSIGIYAFQLCITLTTVTIGSSVTSIGDYAFSSCTALTAVTIPDAVSSIGDSAFYECITLTAVSIGSSVTSIGNGAFSACSALTSLPVSTNNTVLYNDPDDNGIIYKIENGTASLYVSVPTKETYEMLSTIQNVDVTSVISNAFYLDASLAHIVLSDAVTQIGESAFQGCSSLSHVIIPANVTTIDTRAFVSASALASVYFLGAKPSTIGDYAFTDIKSPSTAYYLSSYSSSWGSTPPTGFTYLETFTISDLRAAEYTVTELQTLGVSDSDILDAGFSDSELTAAGYTINTPTPSSNVCFPAKTPVLTNCGYVNIEEIDPAVHTIRNKKIVAITKTVAHDKNLVRIAKHALGKNYPEKTTFISQNHKVFCQGQMVKAKHLVDNCNVTLVPYNGQVLYNVLLAEHEKMQVNNLIVETLHPEHKVAKLYRFLKNVDAAHHGKMIALFNKCDREQRLRR